MEAFAEASCAVRLEFVRDGVELLDYLRRRGGYADLDRFPCPSLVLMDLNMPRKGGREVVLFKQRARVRRKTSGLTERA